MTHGVPIQLIQHSTLKGKKGFGRTTALQEKATRAWNFCTALYYKADGVPWRPTSLFRDTCYVGVDFYVARDARGRLNMRSCIAQAFDFLGQGLVLRGEPFEWDQEKYGRMPHMTTNAAQSVMQKTLNEYVNVSGRPPVRVVVHKSSSFWGKDHAEHNELEGFANGVAAVFPRCQTDFLTLRQTGLRLFREGKYPPLRGTYFRLDDEKHFIYTMGYVPYFETYPGSYVPEPWEITEHHGCSAPKDLCHEILALTKMNVNNCAFADGVPITLSFSHKIGEVMKHIPEGLEPARNYKFYM
jgi:hypothetical protein